MERMRVLCRSGPQDTLPSLPLNSASITSHHILNHHLRSAGYRTKVSALLIQPLPQRLLAAKSSTQ